MKHVLRQFAGAWQSGSADTVRNLQSEREANQRQHGSDEPESQQKLGRKKPAARRFRGSNRILGGR